MRLSAIVLAGALALTIGALLIAVPIWRSVAPRVPVRDAAAQEADWRRILDAIHSFHRKNGLWPADLDELENDDFVGWRYEASCRGAFRLFKLSGDLDSIRAYHCWDGKGHWETLTGYEIPGFAYEPPNEAELPAEELDRNVCAAIQRRIDRFPDQMPHRKELIRRLMESGQLEEAHRVCRRCLDRWPEHWWANLMMALLEARVSSPQNAEIGLRSWVERDKSFFRCYFLAHYLQAVGKASDALVALNEGVKAPCDCNWTKTAQSSAGESLVWNDTVYLNQAAAMAYKGRRDDICIAICDRWEAGTKTETAWGDTGHFVYRAACRLRQGKSDEAIRLIDEAINGRNYGHSFNKGVLALRKAAVERNFDHVFELSVCYDDGPGNELELFCKYR